MALPKIKAPLFELKVPSTKKKVNYRAFTVKEEKILLVAQESDSVDQMILAIKQVINNCITGAEVDDLTMFDIEYILLNIRGKSVSNIIEFAIKDPETEEQVDLSLDVNDIEVHFSKEHSNLVKINDEYSIEMSYPKFDDLKIIANVGTEQMNEAVFDLIVRCMKSLLTGDEIYQFKDFSEAEVMDFMESLSTVNVKEIKTFFDTMPKVRYEAEYTRADGKKKTFIAEGTETFFI